MQGDPGKDKVKSGFWGSFFSQGVSAVSQWWLVEGVRNSPPVRGISRSWTWMLNLAMTDEPGTERERQSVVMLRGIFAEGVRQLDKAQEEKKTPRQQADLALAILRGMDTNTLAETIESLAGAENKNSSTPSLTRK